MKVWVWIVIFLVIIGIAVFLFFNRPAVMLIRKTFAELAGIELVDAKEYHMMKAENIVLSAELGRYKERAEIAEEREKELMVELSQKQLQVEGLQASLSETQTDLADYLATIEEMITDEQVVLFDSLTVGKSKTVVSEDKVITEAERIKDANKKITEWLVFRNEKEIYLELIVLKEEKLSDYRHLYETTTERVDSYRLQAEVLDMQLKNCYAVHEDILKNADNTKRIGIVVGVVGVLVALIF